MQSLSISSYMFPIYTFLLFPLVRWSVTSIWTRLCPSGWSVSRLECGDDSTTKSLLLLDGWSRA